MSLGSGLLPLLRQRLPQEPKAGELVLVSARAGVGKSGFLVQLALDGLDAGRGVVHLTLSEGLDDLRRRFTGADAKAALREKRLLLQAYPESKSLDTERLRRARQQIWQPLGLDQAGLLLIDGIDWAEESAETVEELKSLARACGAVLWATALAHRHEGQAARNRLPEALKQFAQVSDLLLSLEPEGERLRLHLLRAYGTDHAPDPRSPVADDPLDLLLDRRWLRPVRGDAAGDLRPADCLLLSGGADGAEAAFGEEAERAGVTERNFSFAGHAPTRQQNQVLLSESELAQGNVSWSYITTHMQRDYKNDPKLKQVLQSIWHMVNPAGEVYVIGALQQDGTVKGGTGWAAELARHLKKPVFVFDQEDKTWSSWYAAQQRWQPCDAPIIRSKHFAGSGTRHLNDAGRQAIRELFERSFS